ncbi:MAG: hypothetical protein SOZ34_10575 [Clostridia bacterium]|nr:hypothetical protein [Clostridia bacterium]
MIYKLFDLYWNIETKFKKTEEYLKDYLYPYDAGADESIKITNEEIQKELEAAPGYEPSYYEMICIFRHIAHDITAYDGMFIHSAVVSLDNNGYMFLGKSGAGKTTHAMLWEKYFDARAEIINGDKPIIRFLNNSVYAYGNPWGGKEGKHKNKCVKLKCGCFIVQSSVNRIRKLTSEETFRLILNSVAIPDEAELKIKFYDLLDKLLQTIPFYVMECDISDNAVLTAYKAMGSE